MLNILKKDIKIENIKKLEFRVAESRSYNGNIEYKLKCTDKCTVYIKPYNVSEDDAQEVELTKEQVKEIEDLLNKYHVGRWDGFNGHNRNVLDGRSFSLSITLKSGENISAHGYMKYPRNYNAVVNGLDEIIGSLYVE